MTELMSRPLRFSILACLFLLLSGCATVDLDVPKEASRALVDTADTTMGRDVAALAPLKPGEAGFYLLEEGIEALAARFRLAELAERSLDVQYYLITNDDIGIAFIGALLDAADRGVRIRLLLDDIQTQGYDAGMAALDSHPNFTVRVFNPFGARSFRAGSARDFSRINRRMHNKSFTADNQVTIIGGRNIADEYFSYRDDVNFGDLDVLSYGPVVGDVSNMFDEYWNSRYAAPVEHFAKLPDDPEAELLKLRAYILERVEYIKQTRYIEAFKKTWESFTAETPDDPEGVFIAKYRLAYDSPDKADKKLAREAGSILAPLSEVVAEAQSQLVIISPYFVPLKDGIKQLSELQARGVNITIITNSLAANNHGVVHSGYGPTRKPLLKAGVRIFEVRPDAEVSGVDRGGSGAALATLHTKAFLVDREKFFLGSFNWDPRSFNINTELGVIIESAEMSSWVSDQLDISYDKNAYEVVLNENGKLRWVDRSGDEEIWFDKEPQTSWWRRFSVGFMRILPINSQL